MPFSNVIAKSGHPLVLRCQIPKTEPLNLRSVRWSKKDFHYADLLPPLETSTYYAVGKTGDLYFSYVTGVDTGDYVCVVGNTILSRTVERIVKVKVALGQGKEIHNWLTVIIKRFYTLRFKIFQLASLQTDIFTSPLRKLANKCYVCQFEYTLCAAHKDVCQRIQTSLSTSTRNVVILSSYCRVVNLSHYF